MEYIQPAERVVLHREGHRWILIRPSDGNAAFLGFPYPMLAVRSRGLNVYGLFEAFVYQRGSCASRWQSASEILAGDDVFTVRGTGNAAKLAERWEFIK